MLDLQKIIDVLERAKHEHVGFGDERLGVCGVYIGEGQCDCGAEKLNAEIDAAIAALKADTSARPGELERISDVSDYAVNCRRCGKAVTLHHNGGELDTEYCCGLMYFLTHERIDLVISELPTRR